MNERIAFFDFDGTITTKDTMPEFIRFYKGSLRYLTGIALMSPFLIAYKAGLIKNSKAKERFLSFFFKGERLDEFEIKCRQFATEVIPSLVRPKAKKEIEQLKAAGVTVVIVSASAEHWIRYWAEDNSLLLMGTKLAIKDGRISGYFDGNNCYGDEKVCRIREKFSLQSYSEIFCYGDSSGDKPMLALATHAFYKPFR